MVEVEQRKCIWVEIVAAEQLPHRLGLRHVQEPIMNSMLFGSLGCDYSRQANHHMMSFVATIFIQRIANREEIDQLNGKLQDICNAPLMQKSHPWMC